MKDLQAKRDEEKRIAREMVLLYCRKNHKTPEKKLCNECSDILEYANARTDRCPYMATKTFCDNCKTPCYRTDMREKIRTIMRWSGPRMIFYHPVLAIKHIVQKIGSKN